MNKGILGKLKYNYIFQLESGLQFGTDEKGIQGYQSGTEGVLDFKLTQSSLKSKSRIWIYEMKIGLAEYF